MRKIAPIVICLLELITLGFLFFGEKSYLRIDELRKSIAQQQQKNREEKQKVEDLKMQAYKLQNDPRALEKEARNELGMARPNELIYIFEKDKAALQKWLNHWDRVSLNAIYGVS